MTVRALKGGSILCDIDACTEEAVVVTKYTNDGGQTIVRGLCEKCRDVVVTLGALRGEYRFRTRKAA